MFKMDQETAEREIATGTFLGTVCQEPAEWDAAAMDGEIMTGWFVLALRETIDLAGHARSPSEGLAYLARVADEVNSACDSGALACGPARSSLAPPWRWDDLGLTLKRTCRGVARFLTLDDIAFFPTWGSPDQLASVQALTLDQFGTAIGTSPAPPTSRTLLDSWKAQRLADIRRVYAALFAPAVIGAALCALFLAVVERSRICWPLFGAALVLLVAGGARLGLLAYMDATAFPYALNPMYMLPIYPLVMAAIALLLVDGVRVLVRIRRRHP
jgi:hypothetical protein